MTTTWGHPPGRRRPRRQVTPAWQLKEIAHDLYAAADLDAARRTLDLLFAWADHSGVPERRRFARTVRRWHNEVLAYFTTAGASNGPTEAVNLTIKQIQRTGRGFTNFDNYLAPAAAALRRPEVARPPHYQTPGTHDITTPSPRLVA